MTRVLVTGAGAVGGYFGGRLAQAGRDVTFLVRPQRAQQLRERGLQIQSPHGDAQFPVNLVTADAIDGSYDLILVAVKTYALKRAMTDLGPAVGSDSIVLPALNGMQHIDALSAALGSSHVFGGVCVVATTVDEAGRILQLNDQQELTYGELDGSRSARLNAVDSTLQRAGFTARASSTIVLDMWEKWVFIAALGASTCLLRGSTGDILGAPRGKDLILAIFDECVAVANAAGYSPRAQPLERFKTMLTDAKRSLTSSMYRDLQKGAQLEADAILGDMCRRGEAAHLALPLLDAAYAQLSIYEGRHMHPALPEELRAALETYRKNLDGPSWTALSQVEVSGTDVLDAFKRFKPDFPDPYPLPVEDVVQDNAAFYEWPELPNPDDVLRAVTAVLKPD